MVIKTENKFGRVNCDDDVGVGLAARFLCTGNFWHDNHGRKWDRLLSCYGLVHMKTTLLAQNSTRI